MPVTSPELLHEILEYELNGACSVDPGLKPIIKLAGIPDPRTRPANFATMAKIINAQQLSTHAAAAIWSRLESECRGNVTPRKIINRDIETLKCCGLSGRKISYIQGLARSILNKEIDISNLDKLTDDELIVELTKIKGLGRWSAEIFSMFALNRKDIFPAGDLALRVAIQRYEKMLVRPSEEEVRKYATRWSPHQSAVALLMWKYYGATTLE